MIIIADMAIVGGATAAVAAGSGTAATAAAITAGAAEAVAINAAAGAAVSSAGGLFGWGAVAVLGAVCPVILIGAGVAAMAGAEEVHFTIDNSIDLSGHFNENPAFIIDL